MFTHTLILNCEEVRVGLSRPTHMLCEALLASHIVEYIYIHPPVSNLCYNNICISYEYTQPYIVSRLRVGLLASRVGLSWLEAFIYTSRNVKSMLQ